MTARLPLRTLLALDRSVRSYDKYGRLHVSMANISKAGVNEYWGREIPGCDELGLQRDKLYHLLRDPVELAKAAATFNGIQLLLLHIPVHASAPQTPYIVGTLGTDANFVEPYLRNALTVWSGEAIRAIEADEQKQLSAGYGYTPDMTPGVYRGTRYDGVMRNIHGNHVTLVVEGRAGADVVIGDSKLNSPGKDHRMNSPRPSQMATMAEGALLAHLRPLLAQDAKLPRATLQRALAGTTAKNWLAQKPIIAGRLNASVSPLLAQDAGLGQIVELLDKLDPDEDGDIDMLDDPMDPNDPEMPVEPVTDADPDPDPGMADPADPPDPAAADPAAADPAQMDDPVDKALAFLKDLIRPEDIAMVAHILKPSGPKVDEEKKPPFPPAKDEDPTVTKPNAGIPPLKKPAEKPAMDAKLIEQNVIGRMRAIAAAEREVKPWAGTLALDSNTVEGVYKLALDVLQVDVKGVHPSAYRAVLMAQPKPGDRMPHQRAPTQAMDAAAGGSFAQRFPEAAKRRLAVL